MTATAPELHELHFSIQIAMSFVCRTTAIVVLTKVQHKGLTDPKDQDFFTPVVMGAAVTVPHIGLIIPRALLVMKRQRGWNKVAMDLIASCQRCFCVHELLCWPLSSASFVQCRHAIAAMRKANELCRFVAR